MQNIFIRFGVYYSFWGSFGVKIYLYKAKHYYNIAQYS